MAFFNFFVRPVPPPPNAFIGGPEWAYIYKYAGNNYAKAADLVYQGALAMSIELGVASDPESAFGRTHDGGQTLVTRLKNGLSPFQPYYGRNKNGSLMTKEQSEARAASKKAAYLAEQNGEVGAVDKWFRENM
jgi:hypothetical protein